MHKVYSMCIMFVLAVGYAHAKAFPSEAQCGIATASKRKGRIINGEVAQVAQMPWIVSIKYGNTHNCGGSIISDRFILTAAHCFEDVLNYYRRIMQARTLENETNPLTSYVVTLGEHNQLVEETHSVNYTIKRMIFHEKYQKVPLINDIVLLELNEQIEWTDHIRPICLPSENVQTGRAMSAGWGRDLHPDVTHADNKKLRFIELNIFENSQCNHIYIQRQLNNRLLDSQMCAGTPSKKEAYRDTNDGDSGGPLEVNLGGRAVLVGITSMGTLESIPPKAPGIYTRVFEYLDWIAEHTRAQ